MSRIDADILRGGELLPLVEDFYTIQGEGFHSGKPAYFIRLGGCDVGCKWCDAKFTWDARRFPPVEASLIFNELRESPEFTPTIHPKSASPPLLDSSPIPTLKRRNYPTQHTL